MNPPISKLRLNELTYQIVGAAIEVHKQLGPGLLEGVYETCFLKELTIRGLSARSQIWVPIHYKGLDLNAELRLDVLVEEIICVELKVVVDFAPIHDAILLSYMKLLKKPKGILINFHCNNIVKEGQRTLVNELFAALPEK